jgi:hypothetical protein
LNNLEFEKNAGANKYNIGDYQNLGELPITESR